MSGNLRFFKHRFTKNIMAAGAPSSPKAFIDGAPPHTLIKGTSTLDNPKASRFAPALTLTIKYVLIEHDFHLTIS